MRAHGRNSHKMQTGIFAGPHIIVILGGSAMEHSPSPRLIRLIQYGLLGKGGHIFVEWDKTNTNIGESYGLCDSGDEERGIRIIE